MTNASTTPPVYYTPAQVAAILQVAVRTVYAMIHRGELPVKRAGPRRYRVPAWGLDAKPLAPAVVIWERAQASRQARKSRR